MGLRRVLVVAAAATAALGVVALVTGSGSVAALSGVGAIAVASLAFRHRVGTGTVSVPGADHDGDPSPGAGAGEALASDPAPDEEPVPVAPGALDELVLDALLRNRIAFARRTLQPLSVVHVDVGASDRDAATQESIAVAFSGILRESDVFGRRSDGIYVFVLADTGEDGAVWTAERLRRGLGDDHRGHVFFAGIACYPTHALEADAVDAKAASALEAAREWQRDRIEVALG